MKAGKTLQELAIELDRQQTAKKDLIVDMGALSMEAGDTSLSLHVKATAVCGINDIAHRQIGQALKIPAPYYDRMRAEYPELLAQNVNGWFSRSPDTKRMLRTMDGTARAFLSDRYRRIDNIDIARITLPIIEKMPGIIYESCNLSPDYMYIKVVNPRLTAEVSPGDIVQAGVVISNSETGQGAVCVQPLIFRLVCSNGMVVNEARARRNHIGRVNSSDENLMLYSEATLEADDKAFIMKVQDTVRAAVDEARFATVLDKLRESKEKKLNTKDIPSVVKMAAAGLKLTEAEGDGILNHLIQDADYTLYGLANAVTRYSQDVEDYDRASKLEEIGYQVITMSPELFRQINHVSTPVPGNSLLPAESDVE